MGLGKKNFWTPGMDETILKMKADGLTYEEIAQKLNIGLSTAQSRAKRLGIVSAVHQYHVVWTPVMDETLTGMYARGATWKEIGAVLGIELQSVRRRTRKLGLSRPQPQPQPSYVEPAVISPKRSTMFPYPPGAPETWGLISADPYPEHLAWRVRE